MLNTSNAMRRCNAMPHNLHFRTPLLSDVQVNQPKPYPKSSHSPSLHRSHLHLYSESSKKTPVSSNRSIRMQKRQRLATKEHGARHSMAVVACLGVGVRGGCISFSLPSIFSRLRSEAPQRLCQTAPTSMTTGFERGEEQVHSVIVNEL
jgi:hypothetical protein